MKRTIQKQILALAAAGAMFSLTTGTAAAQVRPAYMKNTDEPGRQPYQYTVAFFPSGGGCSGSICSFAFPPVPLGKRLVIQHVSIFAYVTGSAPPNFLAFRTGAGGVTNSNNLAIVQPAFLAGPPAAGTPTWLLDRDVLVYYEPGATPTLRIDAPANFANFESNATVHGYLIDATN